MTCRRDARAKAAGALALLAVLGGGARVGAAQTVTGQLDDLEARTNELLSRVAASTPAVANEAMRGLVDAQALLALDKPAQAAKLLRALVDERPPGRIWTEGLVLLSEALVALGDPVGAQRALDEASPIARGTPQEALVLAHALALAVTTRDEPRLDELLARSAQLPADRRTDLFLYQWGRAALVRRQLEVAEAALKAVPAGAAVHVRSRYVLGAVAVARADHATALVHFDECLRAPARVPPDREAQELAHLATARLLYMGGQFTAARQAYGRVSRESPRLPQALEESAWAAIAGDDMEGAQRSIDLLLLAKPDHPQAAELRILRANALLRLARTEEARSHFAESLRAHEPTHQALLALGARGERQGQALGAGGTAALVRALEAPPYVADALRAHPDVARVDALVREAAALQGALDEARTLLATVEDAVRSGGSGRGLLGDLAPAHDRALTLMAEALVLRRRLQDEVRALAAPYLDGDSQREQSRMADEQARLEPSLRRPPLTMQALEAGERHRRGRLWELEQRTADVDRAIKTAETEIARLAGSESGGALPASQADADPLPALRAELAALRATSARLHQQIAAALDGPGGGREATDSPDGRVLSLMRRELDLLLRARARMEPLSRGLFDDRVALLDRTERLRAKIGEAEDRLLRRAGARLRRVRETAAEERQTLTNVTTKIAEARAEAQTVGRDVTTSALAALERRFYDLTITSDVGLIDVAWARKDLRSEEIAHLVASRKRELQMVETELGTLVPEESAPPPQ